MKFMKLGSKPDLFQTEGDNIRYVASELTTDVVVNVGDVKFYVHKFPLLSKSAKLQQLVSVAQEDIGDEITIHDIPGGPSAFEVCAKFCYGMTVTLNAYNVVATRCAAEYLGMYETVEKGNLIYKIEVFLNSSIFRSWKDSIIVLQTTKSLFPWSGELKLCSHCLESVASKVSIDVSKVEWSYTYNHRKLPSENGNDPQWNGVRKPPMVPKDWWVEDICELPIDLYKQVIQTIKAKERTSADVFGESLKAYVMKRFPGLNKGIIQSGDIIKSRTLIDAIICLLPVNESSVPCSFLLKLFQASILLGCGEMERMGLMRHIGRQLEEATVGDLLIRAPPGEPTIYNVDVVQDLVEEFVKQELPDSIEEIECEEIKVPRFISNSSKLKVAKLIDGYIAEVARDPSLPLSKFLDLADKVSGFPRPTHDGIYRAIDMFLKEHPDISKSDRKRICKFMDCKKLSVDASMHAMQNERLPMRVVVQVLFFEQMRATAASGDGSTPDLPGSMKTLLLGGSHRSSRSTTTNTDEDWDSVPTAEELKSLKGEPATLRLKDECNVDDSVKNPEKFPDSRVKGMLMSKKIFSKLWSNKDRQSDLSSSDTSESPNSTQETKSTPSRSRRHSLS